ncbi:MAG TPA: alpha/beta fold hydrolase [Salinimicrobium sp.]|nr:alpha/beta fold hydrolase [Salinimicrobium sp.]
MKLHSIKMGSGQPFLILHGFLGMGDNWKTLGKKFSEEGYEVHLIDQRNHGRSPHSEEMSYTAMAKDVKTYCSDHDLKDCILLGHSMGGKTAMFTATYFPDLTDKLIVVDIAPKYYAPHHQQILQGLNAVEQAKPSSRDQAEEILGKYVKEKAVRMFLMKNLYWKSKGRLALRFNLKTLSEKVEAVSEALPSDKIFSKPSLFIKGQLSDYISSEDKGTISGQFPKSEIVEIPQAGHWVHAEKQKEFYNAVLKFLK